MLRLKSKHSLNSVRSFLEVQPPPPQEIPQEVLDGLKAAFEDLSPKMLPGRAYSATYLPLKNVRVSTNEKVGQVTVTADVQKPHTYDDLENFAKKIIINHFGDRSQFNMKLRGLDWRMLKFEVQAPNGEDGYYRAYFVKRDRRGSYDALIQCFQTPVYEAMAKLGIPESAVSTFGWWENPDDVTVGDLTVDIIIPDVDPIADDSVHDVATLVASAVQPNYSKAGIKTLTVTIRQKNHSRVLSQDSETFDITKPIAVPNLSNIKRGSGLSDEGLINTVTHALQRRDEMLRQKFGNEIRYKTIDFKPDRANGKADVLWVTQGEFDDKTAQSMIRYMMFDLLSICRDNGIDKIDFRIVCRDGEPEYRQTSLIR